jgi:hypothetical protein
MVRCMIWDMAGMEDSNFSWNGKESGINCIIVRSYLRNQKLPLALSSLLTSSPNAVILCHKKQ